MAYCVEQLVLININFKFIFTWIMQILYGVIPEEYSEPNQTSETKYSKMVQVKFVEDSL